MGEIDACLWGKFVVALVPMPEKLRFIRDRLEWGFLMHDEAGADVFVCLTSRAVEHIRNSKLLDAGPEDENAIEGRLPDIQQAASRKFERGEFAPKALHSLRVIEINPADLDDRGPRERTLSEDGERQ
jgi:hypothetical protein